MSSTLQLSSADLKYRRTKIVATIGPASSSPEIVRALIDTGVNVFRLNFSHGDHASHARAAELIRTAAAEAGQHIALLADLCGPKIRVGRFTDGEIRLIQGEEVTVTVRDVIGSHAVIPSEYRALARDVAVGNRILLNDGNLELEVLSTTGTDVRCLVVHGGPLSDRKGINLPGIQVSTPSLTEKDRADAAFAAEIGVDWVALSFVRAARDVEELREFLQGCASCPPIIAKIEKPEALNDIAGIVAASDGLMIARGDLGVEMRAEEVPLIQEELIRVAVRASKPVIVATQMLESMIENSRPTRAEVSDVASAALSGADAVMLSGETAAGRYPVEAVRAMDRVLRRIEGYQWTHGQFEGIRARDVSHESIDPDSPDALTRALSRATSQLSRELSVRSIVVPTNEGRAARTVVGVRPAAPIVAACVDAGLCRRLSLSWGLLACLVDAEELREPAPLARKLVAQLQVAEPGQLMLLVWDPNAGSAEASPTVSILKA